MWRDESCYEAHSDALPSADQTLPSTRRSATRVVDGSGREEALASAQKHDSDTCVMMKIRANALRGEDGCGEGAGVVARDYRRVRDDQWIALIFHPPAAARVSTMSSAPAELIARPR